MSETTEVYGVVVVSFGSGPELDTFLTSLEQSTVLPDHVVVVENGPQVAQLHKHSFPVTVLHRPDNPGYGSAVNVGVDALPHHLPWVLISNPDVTLDSAAINTLLTATTQHEKVGAVGPALLNPDGTVYPSARAVPGIGVGIGHAVFGAVWKNNPWTKAYRGEYSSQDPRECGWLSGACLLVRRKAFDEIQGFDTNYFMFMEDVDLGMRLGQAGWTNLYVPEAKAVHVVGHATSGAKSAMAKAHHDSAKRFLAKRYKAPWWAPVRFVLNLGLSFRLALVRTLKGSSR